MTKNIVYAALDISYEDDDKEQHIRVDVMRGLKNKYKNAVIDCDDILNPKYYADIWTVSVEYDDNNKADQTREFQQFEDVLLYVFGELEWKHIEKITAWEFKGARG